MANFAWWNEDHNYYIDLRASIPVRRGALAMSAAVDADRYDDATFLFYPEFFQVASGDRQWKDVQSIVTARHEYYDHYQDQRATIPKVVGTLPEKVDDPVLIEIFGMHHHYFEALAADGTSNVLSGFPASAGTYTGRARVMVSAMELFDLEGGEILVTEATSPNWTPAFAIIGACVCDGGGSLTHAATVSREYGIPCVVGTSVATSRITTGDLIEVDGTKGTVTIMERAAGPPEGAPDSDGGVGLRGLARDRRRNEAEPRQTPWASPAGRRRGRELRPGRGEVQRGGDLVGRVPLREVTGTGDHRATAPPLVRPGAALVLAAPEHELRAADAVDAAGQAAVAEGPHQAGGGDVAEVAGDRCLLGPEVGEALGDPSGTPLANRWAMRSPAGRRRRRSPGRRRRRSRTAPSAPGW